jgi:hypothetical protein
MGVYIKGTNIELQGTLESLSGVALVSGLVDAGDLIYAGETEVWWDEQKTVYRTRPDGDEAMVWIDTDGNEHVGIEVEERDGELDEDDPTDP